MRSRHALVLGVLAGALVISLGSSDVARAGDASAGKEKAVVCQACHMAPAGSPGDTPHLAGQREGYLARQLKAFKSGDRKQPLMNAIASQLSDADIDNIAAFWGSQPPGSDIAAPPDAVAAIKKSHMTFPRDFPRGYTQYLSANNTEKKVVSKTYVNAVGLAAARAGKQMPDGSIIIVVNSSAKLDASGNPATDKDGGWVPDKVQGYTGMEARPSWGKDIPEMIRNQNWNYAVFTADKQPRAEVAQTICLVCHKPKAGESFVFSWKELQQKAGKK